MVSVKNVIFSHVFLFTMLELAIKCSCSSTFLTGYATLNQRVRKVSYFDVNSYFYAPEGELVKLRLFGHFTPNTYIKLSLNLNCKGSQVKKASFSKRYKENNILRFLVNSMVNPEKNYLAPYFG